MTKDQVLHMIEDLLDSHIPLKNYRMTIDRDNGNSTVTIHRCDKSANISDMHTLSEIFNAYSTDWDVVMQRDKVVLIIK